MFPGSTSLESSIDSAPTYTLDMGASHRIPLQDSRAGSFYEPSGSINGRASGTLDVTGVSSKQ